MSSWNPLLLDVYESMNFMLISPAAKTLVGCIECTKDGEAVSDVSRISP